MRTAIFVYKPTSINISTYENDLQLCSMDATVVSLSEGENARTIEPGIYKIVSTQDVQVTGDTSAFDVVMASGKDNDPTPPPLRATESFAPLDTSALQAFLAVPDAKVVANP
jgi:hypothetical protein